MIAEQVSTKTLIKQRAAVLFRGNGFPATSMRQLAKEVGLEAPSIYSHFRSKEEILKTIVFEVAGLFFKTALPIYEDVSFSSLTKLTLLVHSHIQVIADNMDSVAVFFHDWRHLDKPNLDNFKHQRHQYEKIFLDTIQKGISEGVFREADTKFVALTLFSTMNWTYEWYNPSKNIDPKHLADNLCDVILKGILK